MTTDWGALTAVPDLDPEPEPEPEPARPPRSAEVCDRVENLLFESSYLLTYIRAMARARMVSPFALLGTVVAHTLAATPYTLRGPEFIGSAASLNFFTAIVGPSGTGKSACVGVFDDMHLLGSEIERLTPSSGEGIVTLFVEVDKKGEQTQVRHQVISVVDEIGTLGAMQSRKGSTLSSILRSAWSGSGISQHAAEAQRRRNLRPGTYRYCMVAGVQPSTASILLDDAGAGTPQRFLWMPATDANASSSAPEPAPLTKVPDRWPDWITLPGAIMPFPDEVRTFVRLQHEMRMRGGESALMALDGHAVLTRVKVAAAMALMHGRAEVEMPFWDMSGLVMEVSDAVRAEVVQAQVDAAREVARTQGRHDAERAQTTEMIDVDRAAQRIAERVHREGRMTRTQVRDLLGRDKAMLDAATQWGLGKRWITVTEEPRGDGSDRVTQVYTKGEKVPPK